MSTVINVALINRLTGTEVGLTGSTLQATIDLASLLTTDINTGLAIPGRAVCDVIFNGNKNDAPTLYPLITFRPGLGGTIDARFGDGAYGVEGPIYDFEFWDNSRSGTLITDIDDAVARCLDRRRGASPLPVTSGLVDYVCAFTPIGQVYDAKLNAWAGVIRYRMVERK